MKTNKKFSLDVEVVKQLQPLFADGSSFALVLSNIDAQIKDAALRSKIKARCFDLLRWQPRCEIILNKILNKPLPKKEIEISILLYSALTQIMRDKNQSHAIVNGAVDAAKLLNKKWAGGMVNACLRRFLREYDTFMNLDVASDVMRYAHPQWLIDSIKQSWPDDWQRILQANNKQAPMTIRVNRNFCGRDQYQKQLFASDVGCGLVANTKTGLQLEKALPVNKLPGFFDGSCSVQDAAGQMLEDVINKIVDNGDFNFPESARLLDICAAPGSKTCHMLEAFEQFKDVVLLDIDAKRLQMVEENLQRLKLHPEKVKQIAVNALDIESWWGGVKFDLVLCDMPCSGSGVIRRHPDIKLLRRSDDISKLAVQQAELLQAIWPCIKSGGIVIYSTCSILSAENDQVIEAFCKQNQDARQLSLDVAWGHDASCGKYLLPGEKDSDGFYYACLQKG